MDEAHPVPTLPIELVAHIIELSLPERQYHTFAERYATLRTLSLVNNLWKDLAHDQLYKHVLVEDTARLDALAVTLPGSGRASQVKSIRFGHADCRWDWTDDKDDSALINPNPIPIDAFEHVRALLLHVTTLEELSFSVIGEVPLKGISHPSECL